MKTFTFLSKKLASNTLRFVLIAMLILVNTTMSISQVSTSYTFSTSNTAPYVYITGGTVYGGPNDDDNYYLANIGYSFNYNGVSFTTLWVDANGFITFGNASTPPSSTYYFGPPLQYNTNCIAAFSNDLMGDSLPNSEMRIETIGTAPNRTCVIQWRDWGEYGASGITHPSTAQIYNFQIRLNENNGNGSIDVVYGGYALNATPYNSLFQVGLSGATTSDFNNRTSSTGWTSTTAGTTNTSSMTFSATYKPDSGRTYSWVIPPAPMVMDSFSTIQSTKGALQNSTNNPIIAAVVYTHGTANPQYISQLNFNTTGCNRLADITNAKVYYTGTNSVFSTGAIVNQFGSTITSPSGALVFTGIDTLNPGANYFWLTYSVASSAIVGDTLDGQCINITDSINRTHTPNTISPAGIVKVILPLNGNYTINPSAAPSSTNFISFDDAIAALQLNGVSGPVKLTVSAGTYALTTSISIGFINGTNAINSVTFDGVNAANVTLTGSFSAPIVLLNLTKYIVIRNFTITNSYVGSCAGVTILGSSLLDYGTGCGVKKCIINLPNTGTLNSAGISMTTVIAGTSFSGSVLMDSIVIDSNTINGGYYGIGIYGALSVAFNHGFKIRSNTLNDIYYYGIYMYYVMNAMDIMYNNINMFTGAGYYGMYLASCTNNTNYSHNFIGNKITNFYFYGMYITVPGGISAAFPLKIYNNTISSGTSNATNCLYLNSAGYSDVYHNTLVYNFNGTTNTYGPMYFTGGTTINIKNNIFYISATSGSTSCLYVLTNPTGNVINYNNYYNRAGTTLLYRNASLYLNTSYLSATAGGDSSFNVLPSFVSATDFHLADACSPKGVDLTAFVPLDIDGQTRSTSPSIGSDETQSVSNDIAVISIVQPVSPTTPGTSDLKVKVKNVGSTNISIFTIGYRNNGGTLQSQTWSTSTLYPCDTAIVTFTGSQQVTLVSINNILVYTSSPNTTADNNRSNDTLRASLFGPLSGSYTIGGTSADFLTFASATTALQTAGVSGPVTFNVNAGTYNEAVNIFGTINGLNSTTPIVFDGGNGNASTRIITANVATAGTVIINQKNYIRFRNLTITNTNNGNPAAAQIIGNATTTNNGTGCGFSNCVFNLPNVANLTNTSASLNISSATLGYSVSGAIWADSIEVDSNTFNGGYYGIGFYGASNASYNRAIKFRGNTVNAWYYGVYVYYIYNPVDIMSNTVNMYTVNNAYAYYGIYCNTNNNTSTITSTQITGNKVVGAQYYGIYMATPGGTSTAPVKVYNNMVSSASFNAYNCMYINTGGYIEIYHNTLIYNFSSTTPNYGALYYTGSANAWVRNNIFGHEAAGTTATASPAYFATSPTGNQVNFNIYYNKTGTTLLFRSATYFNASNYHTNTAGGDTSYNLIPAYIDAASNNFHITNSCGQRGTDLSASVPTDIDGETRGVPGQIGCDDYPTTTLDLMIDALLQPAFPVSSGAQDVRVRVRNNGANTISTFSIAYKLNSGSAVVLSSAWTGSLVSCDTTTVVFTGSQQISITANTNNTLKVYTYNPNGTPDGYRLNDTVVANVATPMVGNYTIGATASDFTTFAAAIAAMQLRGVGGAINFNVRTGTYNESIILPALQGASVSSNITFRSLANNKDSVIVNAPITNLFIVKYNSASFINFKNMTFRTISSSAGIYGITVIGTSSYDTLDNCKILIPIYPASTSTSNWCVYGTSLTGTGLGFKNNLMSGGYGGMYLYGLSTASRLTGTYISGNTIQDIAYQPYYMYYHNKTFINGNTINMNNSSYTTANYAYIYYSDSSIFANNVFMNTSTLTSLYLYLYYSSTNVGIYNNSFNLNFTGGYGPCIYNYAANNYNLKNNVFSNASSGYAATFYYAPATYQVSSDYNNFYTNGSILINQLSAAATFANLNLWRTANPALDKNSISYRPGFTSLGNSIPNAADSAVWSLNGRATHLSSVLTDINGISRPATTATGVPDIGAYEVTPTSLPPFATANPAAPALGITQTFLFGSDTVARVAWDPYVTVPASFSVRQYSGVRPPLISLANNYMYFYVDMPAPTAYYNSNVYLYYNDSWLGVCPNETDLRLSQKSGTSVWNSYTGTASSVDSVRNMISANVLFDFGYFTGTDNSNPLPVVLAEGIKAVRSGNNILVDWITVSEINSNRYEIERSLDGSRFELAGTVKATGTSNSSRAYSFTDFNIIGQSTTVIYYRLKMIDNDENLKYSPVVKVNIVKSNDPATITVYPNPFTGKFEISFSAMVEDKATISIFDNIGKLISSETINVQKGNNTYTFNEKEGMKAGVYFVNIIVGDKNFSAKVVKY